MKGIVFTEFLEMVEDSFGFELADHIIEACDLPSGGSYTSVGVYDHQEMGQLVAALSQQTGYTHSQLLHAFGKYLFQRFTQGYQTFFHGVPDAFGLLSGIENHIHVEVRKLYPDAELPSFEVARPDAKTMILHYRSERGLADLAEGLIEGCIAHYAQPISLRREDVRGSFETRFTLTHHP